MQEETVKARDYGWCLGEYARDSVFLINPDGLFQEVNRAALQTYGYTREELIGMSIHQLRRQDSIEKISKQMKQAHTGSILFEAVHYRKNGTFFPVEVSSQGITLDGEEYIVSVVRDISDRKAAEKEQRRIETDLVRSNVCHLLLNEVAMRVLTEEPAQEILQLICRSLVNIYQLELVWVGSKEAAGSLTVQAWAGESVDYLEDIKVCWDEGPESQGPAGKSIRSASTQLFDVDHPDFKPWRERAAQFGFRTIAAVPLICRDNVIGTINLYSNQERYFDTGLLQQIEHFASQTAVALEAAEKRKRVNLLSTVVKYAGDGIVVTDCAAVIQWANPAFCRLSGYAAEELVGKSMAIFKSGYQDKNFYQQLWRQILSGNLWRGEIVNRRKDGSLYVEEMSITPVLDEHKEISAFIAIKQDVTERHEAQEKVRQSLNYYIQLFEDFPTLIWRADRNGQLDYFNKKWLEFTGRSKTEEEGSGWLEGVHPEERQLCQLVYRENMERQTPFRIEYRLRAQDHGYRWIVAMGMPFYDLEGHFAGHIGACYDISDMKQAEIDRLQALKMAEKAERMASLGAMTASIAHEINQPLHAIKLAADGFLYWQEKGKAPELEKLTTSLQKISGAVNRIDNIIKHLRSVFSGQVDVKEGVCDCNQAVYDALELVGAQMQAHGISISRQFAAELPKINADAKRLEEAVINMLINAMQELDKLQKPDKEISLKTFCQDDCVVLEMADNGPGVDSSLRERIFEPFFTTKGAGNGMGLGLAIVNNIIRSLEGSIEVQDRTGGGALFTIRLPVLRRG
ncbi:PAS domain S-box protein [Azotosporobacter soli]|uniref:PAS domain S-box protein n=1 Tax=Azotosporobacter soli TaxID=3055040 RepID=UPI0031FEBA01